MSITDIEWTRKKNADGTYKKGRVWNPVTGCHKVSQGCKFCYAEIMHERFNGKGSFKTVTCHDNRLLQPLKWKGKGFCFVNSMSDLFHDDVSFEFIDNVFAVMAIVENINFQILTKRPERMLKYFNEDRSYIVADLMYSYSSTNYDLPAWPLKNVWLGVSVENQEAANKRIPFLLKAPAAIRFLSCEPLIGPVDLEKLQDDSIFKAYYQVLQPINNCGDSNRPAIDWVIVGGESGNKLGVRPMHPDWVRSLRDQCKASGTAFFFKQWGTYHTRWFEAGTNKPVFKMYTSYLQFTQKLWVHKGDKCISIDGRECKIGGDFQKCSYPVAIMSKVGKKISGRSLDGQLHNEMPTFF